MVLFFSFLNYTDSNFGLNDGTITNITVSGGTGTVAVTIKNSANVIIYTGAVPPGLVDQLNLPPDTYTLSAIDQAGEVSDDLEIIIAEKPETILTANITDACNCPDCDCVVTVSSYIHNSDCFLYELFDGTTLIDSYQACTGSEYHQFTGLCTGNYNIVTTELDSLLYTYANPDNCAQEDVIITSALDVNVIVDDWRRFAIENDFFQFNMWKAGGFFNGATPVLLGPNVGTFTSWSGLIQNGTILFTDLEAFFYTGGNPASYTDPNNAYGGGTTPLDPSATRFLGAFNGGQDGLNPPIFPPGWPATEPSALTYGLYYYNLDTGLFVHTTDINGSFGGVNYQWVTFNPKDAVTNIDGVAWPNVTDFYTTSIQWGVAPIAPTTDYTVDPNTSLVVTAAAVGVTEKIKCFKNSVYRNGFISECRYLTYVHDITIGAETNDDDDISIILARSINQEGYSEFLSLDFRIRNDPGGANGGAVTISHNSSGAAYRDLSRFTFNNGLEPNDPNFESSSDLIVRNNPGVDSPLPAFSAVPPFVSWGNSGKIRVKITRTGAQGEFFKIQLTDRIGPFGVVPVGAVAPYVAAYEINFSLLDMNTWVDAPVFANGTPVQGTELGVYTGPTNYGYATYSNPDTSFYHLLFQGEQTNITNETTDALGVVNTFDFTEPCELCYLATNCLDPADTMLVTLPANLPPLDLNVTYEFVEFPDQCWTVEESDDCGGEPGSEIFISTGFIDAADNLGVEDQLDFNWILTVGQPNPIPRAAVISDQSFPGYGALFNALWINQLVSPHLVGTSITEYEATFVLPPAFVPSLVFDILSDVRAVVELNGFVIGDNSNPVNYPNPSGTPANFSTSNPIHFNPSPAINTLKVTITPLSETSGFALAGSITSPGTPLTSTPVTIQEIFIDCIDCLGLCYELTDCEGLLNSIQTDTDLSAYVGQVITLLTCPETCWTVVELPACPMNPVGVYLDQTFPDCVTCLPSDPPPPPLVIRNRTVKPGYDTKGCSPEYVEKISCDFSEALFQQAASRRYGIEFCCGPDLDDLDIKMQLLNFKMITDPEACVTLSSLCCAPCNVVATLITFPRLSCPAPSNVQVSMNVPNPPVQPNCVSVRVNLPIKAQEGVDYNIAGTDCCGIPFSINLTPPTAGTAGLTSVVLCADLDQPYSIDPQLIITNYGNCDCDPVPPFACFSIVPFNDDFVVGNFSGNDCNGNPFDMEVLQGIIYAPICVRADGLHTTSPTVTLQNLGACA